jgi:hypothetical protein
MKPCSSFAAAAATCLLSILALHVRPVASIVCQSCQVDLDCTNFDNNTTNVAPAIGFTICDQETQMCVKLDGLRDIDCPCSNGEDCQSGRCEGLFGATCQAKLEDGQGCNEDSDCVNGNCNLFICLSSRTEEPTSAPPTTTQLRASSPTTDDSNLSFIDGVYVAVACVVLGVGFLVVWICCGENAVCQCCRGLCGLVCGL